ncbi:MAG: transcription termination factor NusA [Anaerolineae bacterium]
MRNEFILAVNQVCAERQLSKEVVLEAVEAALVTAYKRNFGAAGNVSAKIDPETGGVKVYAHKTVVEEVKDPRVQISLAEARQIKPDAELGDVVMIETTPKDFGRIAAQTAKQVILQRIREAERDALYQAFADQEGEIINGVIQSIDAHAIAVNLGKAEATLPKAEQIPGERYRLNQRIRAYVLEVEKTSRGPRIVLSRAHRNMLRRLLELEVPEIANGAVEIKAIAREAGSRSKVAVAALRPGVDPVGSCVGMRGTRIQGVVNELNGEKIDVVEWSPDPAVFIANALSPAQVAKVHLYEDAEGGKTALVIVPDKQLSLAIGKEGQNARLAAKLTGWRIDIKSTSEAAAEMFAPAPPKPEPKQMSAEDLLARAEAILASRPPAEESEPVEEVASAWLDDGEAPAASEERTAAEAQEAEPKALGESEEVKVEEPAGLDLLRWDPNADDDEFEPRSKPKGKDKRASLEFDETTGKLVVKRQRKPGRQRSEWDS